MRSPLVPSIRRRTLIVAGLFAVAAGPAARAQSDPATRPLNGTLGLDVKIGLNNNSQLAALLSDIDPKQIRATDSTLVAFGNRNALSDTMSTTRGVGAARRWIFSKLTQYNTDCGGCMRVFYDDSIQTFTGRGAPPPPQNDVNIVNVVAWFPGRDTTHVVVLGGHYDSCVCSLQPNGTYNTTTDAPGADDDGSGASAMIELARVFSKRYPKGLEHTVIFILHDAEEEGLNGSKQFAARLHARGYKVIAGMTDDIVGNVVAEDGSTDSTSVRIFAADPDNSPSRELGRYVWGLGSIYMPAFEVRPEWRLDRISRGGDHEPYVTLGDAGLRFTERLENYNRQHLPGDDFAHVNPAYIAMVARLNAVTVGSLASAPPVPDRATSVRQRLGTGGGQVFSLTWCPSPGAASYEVLVRRTWVPTWEIVVPVGNATQYLLDRQNDDEYFGVRAVGANGFKSLAASMPGPPAAGAGRAGGGGGGRAGGAGAAGGAAGGGGGRAGAAGAGGAGAGGGRGAGAAGGGRGGRAGGGGGAAGGAGAGQDSTGARRCGP